MKVKNISKVVGPMPITDPYILGVYHLDNYPKGNGKMGPDASLNGHTIGNDFRNPDGWNMYHGETIPGFPYHPHRGFEIVTIVEQGFADHFDSKGSKGRYGAGDVQLMSAGSGVLHGEMFPLLNDDKENPFQLFQIWLNLPAKSKMTPPNYKMLWAETIPRVTLNQANGNVKIKVILGEYFGTKSIAPLEHSWALDPNNHVGIALVDLDPNTEISLGAISNTMGRFVFMYDGDGAVTIADYNMQKHFLADLNGGEEIIIKNGDKRAKLLILEGEPIKEAVVAYGPFVMNTEQEIQDAFQEYRETQFGGWPWGRKESDWVHAKESGRFASYNFGKEEDRP